MNRDTAKILVIGAGVNGSICAVALHNAGVDVTVLARGQHYEELRAGGIIIEDPFKNTRTVTQVPVTDRLDPQDRYDYILVVVRKNQVPALLPALAANGSPNVVFMVNNPSGPEVYTAALGQRVMLGFVFGAGKRDGSLIRGISFSANSLMGRLWPSPFGEVDGTLTPRLRRLVNILRGAGLPAGICRSMTDYLATHASLVAPLGAFALQRGYDPAALARYTDADYALIVNAMREVLDVLPAVGFRVYPPSMVILKIIPRFLLVAGLRAAIPSKFMEVGGMYHISQAPDEMRQLGAELLTLVERSGLPAPVLRGLLAANGSEATWKLLVEEV
ncbi:MAG: 2-dehydropantoate 2-reductase N-terminal domain-containing protein [Anaerolineales bacterium]